eukprot:4466443-Prymnesium_polylepis.3
MRLVLPALLAALCGVSAHGRLLLPARRLLKADLVLPSGHDYIGDLDAPINFKGDDWPESRRFPLME